MKRRTAWLLTWLSILILVVVPVALAVVLSSGCAASQAPAPTWEDDAGALIVVVAHLVDGTDAYAASRYTAAAQVPGVDVAALDRQYAGLNTAIHLARPVLLAHQAAIGVAMRVIRDSHSTSGQKTAAQCQIVLALRGARGLLDQIGEALSVAGLTDGPAIASGVNALVSVIDVAPLCAGVP